LIEEEHYPVPIPAREKGPQIPEWEQKAFKATAFRDGGNIGIHNVNIATVDRDCPETYALRGRFLPPTFMTGHGATPESHAWYLVTAGEPPFLQFRDGAMMVELRYGKGKQTVIPPSVHPSGEVYAVGNNLPVASIGAEELERGVRMEAAAALIARHYEKPGGQYNFGLSLAYYMLRHRLSEEDVFELMLAAKELQPEGVDKDAEKNIRRVITTSAAKLAKGGKATGGTTLRKEGFKKLVSGLANIFGWDAEGKPERGDGNQAKRLINYAVEDASELFRDQNGTPHGLIDGTPIPLDRGCYGWLRRLFWDHEETAASTDLLGTVAGQLRAFAEVSEHEHTLHLRAAQHEGAVYLYLRPGRVARVDADGWKIDPDPPVMFRRVLNLKELPDPERGGSLDLLDDFITAQEDRDHRLAKTWLVLALLADMPRPILLAHGPQGSTKSSVQRVLKNIIDPAKPETLKLREKDFEQNINKAFIPFFDNVSTISDYMADELSKAVTGAGNAVRKLYEDDEDVIREYRRAMLLNGLIIPTEKADLIDRILPVGLKRVPKEERETERRMQALFDARHPKLLGAVLDALSGALANHEEVRGLPRLADWAEYAIALYKQLDWSGYNGFMADWAVIEEGQHETALDSSVLAQCVVAAMREHDELDKSPTDMLKLLRAAASSEGIDTDTKGSDFPASATWLARKLVPIVPTLESLRIAVEEGTRGRGKGKARYIRFYRESYTPPDGDSTGTAGDSSENLLTGIKPLTNGAGTAGDSRTADFPENSKHTDTHIEGGLLFSGKNAVPDNSAVPKAYLSGKKPVSRNSDAVPADGDAVPTTSAAVPTDEDRALRHEVEIVWEEDVSNLRYVRELVGTWHPNRKRIGKWQGAGRRVGYSVLAPDAPRHGSRFLRREFWLRDTDGPNGGAAEAVDPRTVRPGVPGEAPDA
jgi:hypothetical protein